MQYLEEFLTAPDGHEIPVRLWRPNTVDKILVIAHGMAEYCERYAPMADWLTESNIAVVALNHRGHGMDCKDEDLGFYSDIRGWQKVLEDLHQTIQFARKELPNVPVALMGHSMGSFISQAYIQQYGEGIDQLILTSTNRIDRPLVLAARTLAKSITLFKGPRATSKLIDFLSFGSFNNKFKPNRTEYDWLSRDNEHVDAYVNDPYCGFSCSAQMWADFLGGMLSIDYEKWPADLQVHLLSGTKDPVGEMGKGIAKAAQQIKRAGRKLVTFKLYEGGRHELVNETNALEVWGDIQSIVLKGSLD
jgi:alpha-beta hydrolase superfamily lysophospholipase